jgi:AraC-like DNA-binding protein/mannose-6-phosphate isomerase-like protein (cupin superfamily)
MEAFSQYGIGFKERIGGIRIESSDGTRCAFDRIPTNRPHLHRDFYELCYVLSGSGTYLHGLDRFDLRPGCLFVADPDVVHEISSWETRDLELVFFRLVLSAPFDTAAGASSYGPNGKSSDVCFDGASDEISGPEEAILRSFLSGHRIAYFHAAFLGHYIPLLSPYAGSSRTSSLQGAPAAPGRTLDRSFGARLAVRNFILESLQCLAGLQNLPEAPEPPARGTIREAYRYIDAHVRLRIQVADVARHCGVSERSLRRLFSTVVGKGVAEAINERRMDQAGRLLGIGWQVKEASYYLGIDDPGQFSRMFRKYMGETPTDFVRRQRTRDPVEATMFL